MLIWICACGNINAQSWSNEIIQTQSFGMGIKQQKQFVYIVLDVSVIFSCSCVIKSVLVT